MREILAMGLGVGFVSEAEFGHDPRLVPLTIDGAPVAMDEVMICLKERAEAKTIRAFLETARGLETSRDLDAARHLQA
jgi:hypothetical protein